MRKRRLTLREERFGFEPEVTFGILRSGGRIMELPITYDARTWAEGKKIGPVDTLRAVWVILREGIPYSPGRALCAAVGLAAAIAGAGWLVWRIVP